MITVKCDICGKEELNINTLILIRKKIDYCNNPKCKRKALKIRQELKKEVEHQNICLMAVLKRKEKQLLKSI